MTLSLAPPARISYPHRRGREVERKARYYFVVAVAILLTVMTVAGLGMAYRQSQAVEDRVHEAADALFDLIVVTRRWNATYGGVFVEKGPDGASNPYLENPDIVDIDGVVYTKKNPALMTREISAFAEAIDSFAFHITSLQLKNPANAPDPWEREALLAFEEGEAHTHSEEGEPHAHSIVDEADGVSSFRYMRPLYVEEPCLSCHGDQGYEIGDVRGGISVTLPYDETHRTKRITFSALSVFPPVWSYCCLPSCTSSFGGT